MDDEIKIERTQSYRSSSGGDPQNFFADKKKMILTAAGVLAAAVVLYFLAFSGKDDSAEILAQMDQKLAAVEQKIAALDKQLEDLGSGPIKSIAERVEMLEKRPGEKPKPPASPKAQAPSPAKRHHEVKKGETLTSIAKKNGLSVEELRRLNNLSPKSGLSIGQKLIVTRGGKT